MKGTIVLLSLAVAIQAAGTVWAQAPAKPAAPQPAEPAKAESQAPAKAMQAHAKPRKPNPKRSEDARHCLDKASNTEVIKCAEEYL